MGKYLVDVYMRGQYSSLRLLEVCRQYLLGPRPVPDLPNDPLRLVGEVLVSCLTPHRVAEPGGRWINIQFRKTIVMLTSDNNFAEEQNWPT